MPSLRILFTTLLIVGSVPACMNAPANPHTTLTLSTPVHNTVPAPARVASVATTTSSPTPQLTATSTATPTITPTRTTTPTPTVTPTPLKTFILNQCAEIWQPGIYTLASDIVAPGTRDCFYIQSHNVIFDCNNHLIENSTRYVKDKQYGYSAFHIRKFNFPLLESPTNVEIRNCRARYFKIALYASSGRNLYVHNNIFSDNLNTVDHTGFGIFLGLTEGGGIRFDEVEGGIIENNTTDNQAIGIDVRNSDNIVIRNNNASRNSAWGIHLLNTSNSLVVNNTTRDNVRYCKWGSGVVGRGCDAAGIILQDGSSNNVIRDNQVLGDNANGIFIKAHALRCGDNNLIGNNKIIGALYNAIEFSFCRGNRVIGNEMAGSYDAVYFGFSTDTEVRNNVIRDMRNHGILSWNSRGSIIANNEIHNSRVGIYMYWDEWDPKQFGFLPPSPDRYATRDNLIENNALRYNAVAGIRLTDAIFTRVINNTFEGNGKNLMMSGRTEGNIVAGQ